MAESINRRKFFINTLYSASAFFGINSIADSCRSQAVGEQMIKQDNNPGSKDPKPTQPDENNPEEGKSTAKGLEGPEAVKSALTFDAFAQLGLSVAFALWARGLEKEQKMKY